MGEARRFRCGNEPIVTCLNSSGRPVHGVKSLTVKSDLVVGMVGLAIFRQKAQCGPFSPPTEPNGRFRVSLFPNAPNSMPSNLSVQKRVLALQLPIQIPK